MFLEINSDSKLAVQGDPTATWSETPGILQIRGKDPCKKYPRNQKWCTQKDVDH